MERGDYSGNSQQSRADFQARGFGGFGIDFKLETAIVPHKVDHAAQAGEFSALADSQHARGLHRTEYLRNMRPVPKSDQ
jgi:hypothetical protein